LNAAEVLSDEIESRRDESEPSEDVQDVGDQNVPAVMPQQARQEENQLLDDQQNIEQLVEDHLNGDEQD